jgi:uncharacterized protein YkwD
MPVARSLRSLPTAVAVALALLATPALSAPANAATRIEIASAGATAQSDLIGAINTYRAANGRQVLAPNAALGAAASWMAADMAAKNYMAHTSSDGRSPVQRMAAFGYPASSTYTGEDLAAGYATASAVLAAWMVSAAHNSVMLNANFDSIGVGLSYDASTTYKWYWAADFGGSGGTIRAVAPAVVPAPAIAASPARAAPPARAAAPPDAPDAAPAAAPASLPTREDRLWARRIDHLFAVFARMGWP